MSYSFPTKYPASQVSALLAHRIDALVRELLPTGFVDGGRYKVGSITGEPGRSLSIGLHGSLAGIWRDFGGFEAGGDALDLVAATLFGRDIAKARRWALVWLGIGTDAAIPAIERPVLTPSASKLTISGPCTIDLARQIWSEAVTARGSPVEVYLNGRGLQLQEAVDLRYHARCPRGRERLPAMVAAMTAPVTGEFRGVHRTFLDPGIGERKMTLGPLGVIALTPETDIEYAIGICEGIENGLSAAQRHGFYPMFAACNAGRVRSFPLIPQVETIWIFADNGTAGEEAASTCAERWRRAGREALIVAPDGHADWNDASRAEMAS